MLVTLMAIPDDPLNLLALDILKVVPGVDIEIFYVGHSFAERFPVPFLRTDNGAVHYGMEGIKWFAKRMRQQQDDAVEDKVSANLRKVFGGG